MNIFISIIRKLLLLPSLVIKPKKVITFCSYPAFTDNAYGIYKYIKEAEFYKDYRLVWIVLDPKDCKKENIPVEIIHDDLLVLYKKSFLAVWYYLRSKYIFITHGLYSNIPVSRPNTIINLWHGMPLKCIGVMDHKGKRYMANSQILIATSEKFQELMAQSFAKSLEDVLVIGQPRNDLMFVETDFYEKMGIQKSDYESIGIWLPTFRSSTIGDIRVDGLYNEGQISFLDFKMLQELDGFLVQNKKLLIVKLHPMDKLQEYEFSEFSNLLIIKQNDFKSQLYPLLGSTDYLLTDYSSVWIDYDILSKPIGFVMNDVEEYKESRGLTFQNLDQELPGKMIENVDALKEFISEPDKFIVRTGDEFNKYKDNKSSERLMSYLKNKN